MAEGERGDVEHLTTESDDENLADKNTAGNEIKTFTAFQAKRTLSVWKARALNMFQNCSITNVVKKRLRS